MYYVPLIGIENATQYLNLKGSIQYLEDNIQELDFSGMLNFLEEKYEKPFERIAEAKKSSEDEPKMINQ